MKTQGRYTILMGSTNTTHLSLQVSICHNVCARFRSNVLIITTLPPLSQLPQNNKPTGKQEHLAPQLQKRQKPHQTNTAECYQARLILLPFFFLRPLWWVSARWWGFSLSIMIIILCHNRLQLWLGCLPSFREGVGFLLCPFPAPVRVHGRRALGPGRLPPPAASRAPDFQATFPMISFPGPVSFPMILSSRGDS